MSLQSNHYPETLEQDEPDAREQLEASAIHALTAAVNDLTDLGYSFFGDLSPLVARIWSKRVARSLDPTPALPAGDDPIPF